MNEKLRDKVIEILESKNLISIEGDEHGIGLRLNQENDSWLGEVIIDIFEEGMKFTEEGNRIFYFNKVKEFIKKEFELFRAWNKNQIDYVTFIEKRNKLLGDKFKEMGE